MRKFFAWLKGGSRDLRFSYEEHRYSLGVKVLIVFLTVIVLMLAERALADLRDGIPDIPYPNTADLKENRDIDVFHRNVLGPLYERKWQLQSRLDEAGRRYDTGLLEKMIGEKERLYGEEGVLREDYSVIEADLAKVDREIAAKEEELKGLQEIAQKAERPILAEYERRVRIRQLYVFLWEALFWLPFFFFALWWYSRTRRKDSRWEVVSVSVLIAASIISLQSFCVFLWSWIPKEFLRWLWELLQATLLTRIVGYYLIMAVSVLLIGGLVVSVHRRAMNPVRGGKRKIRNGQCPQCSYPLNLSGKFCSGCGRELMKQCGTCKAEVYTWGAVCTACGKEQSGSAH